MRYRMSEGRVVDPEKATESWNEATDFNGSNHISVNTGSQWDHERLYKTAKGRYWLESYSQRDRVACEARWTEPREAAEWLLANDHKLPDDVRQHETDILE
jgi:hypothetical protein